MVRLTAEIVRTAPQGLTCLGDWELDLRGRRLVDITALAPAAGRYDATDLLPNSLPTLSGFPPAPRLRHLHAAGTPRAAATAVPMRTAGGGGRQANGRGDGHRDGGGGGGGAGGREGEDMEDNDGGGRANGGGAGGADGGSKASG